MESLHFIRKKVGYFKIFLMLLLKLWREILNLFAMWYPVYVTEQIDSLYMSWCYSCLILISSFFCKDLSNSSESSYVCICVCVRMYTYIYTHRLLKLKNQLIFLLLLLLFSVCTHISWTKEFRNLKFLQLITYCVINWNLHDLGFRSNL